MKEPKTDCPNYPQCIQSAVWDMFAKIGDRKLILPNCECCNIYKGHKENNNDKA